MRLIVVALILFLVPALGRILTFHSPDDFGRREFGSLPKIAIHEPVRESGVPHDPSDLQIAGVILAEITGAPDFSWPRIRFHLNERFSNRHIGYLVKAKALETWGDARERRGEFALDSRGNVIPARRYLLCLNAKGELVDAFPVLNGIVSVPREGGRELVGGEVQADPLPVATAASRLISRYATTGPARFQL